MYIFHKESFYGKIEYKRYFNTKDQNRINKYTTQLNFRINEGSGRAIYLIGVNDDGSLYGLSELEIKQNLRILEKMCKLLNLEIVLIMNCVCKEKNFLICSLRSTNYKDNLLV